MGQQDRFTNRPWSPIGLSGRSKSSRVAAEDPGSNPAWGMAVCMTVSLLFLTLYLHTKIFTNMHPNGKILAAKYGQHKTWVKIVWQQLKV